MQALAIITTILSYLPRIIGILEIIGKGANTLADFLKKFPEKK